MIKLKKKKTSKISLNDCFLELSEEFHRDLKQLVRISHGKRVIGVRVIEILLYIDEKSSLPGSYRVIGHGLLNSQSTGLVPFEYSYI